MPKARKMTRLEMEQTDFAVRLREYLNKNPLTGEAHSQRELAAFLDVRPQTVSQYCNGITLPNIDTLIKIAAFFNISVEHLMTGKRPEFKATGELIGLSDQALDRLKLVHEGYFEDCPDMMQTLNALLSEKDFYKSLENAEIWISKKSKDLPPDENQFFEWKAAQFMQSFLMEFFMHRFADEGAAETNETRGEQ